MAEVRDGPFDPSCPHTALACLVFYSKLVVLAQ